MVSSTPKNFSHQNSNNSHVVIGIDPASTHIAFVTLYKEHFRVTVSKNLGKSGPEACHNARLLTIETIGETKKWVNKINGGELDLPIHCFYELPVLGRGGVRSTMVQCFTSGAVQATLYERQCPTYPVNVSSWKKAVVGKGNADKREVGEYLRLRWDALYQSASGNQDVYVASAIALYGRQFLEQRVA